MMQHVLSNESLLLVDANADGSISWNEFVSYHLRVRIVSIKL